jgi:hypothetical protein
MNKTLIYLIYVEVLLKEDLLRRYRLAFTVLP